MHVQQVTQYSMFTQIHSFKMFQATCHNRYDYSITTAIYDSKLESFADLIGTRWNKSPNCTTNHVSSGRLRRKHFEPRVFGNLNRSNEMQHQRQSKTGCAPQIVTATPDPLEPKTLRWLVPISGYCNQCMSASCVFLCFSISLSA